MAISLRRSSWRTWPKLKERRKVPRVEGASTRCPRTDDVDPERSTSASSMHSAPAISAWRKVITFAPGWK
jgi:hypothetical protein